MYQITTTAAATHIILPPIVKVSNQCSHYINKKLKEILIGERPNYGWLSEETVDSNHRLKKE